MKTPLGILIDTTRCNGCEQCIDACKQENNLGKDRPWRGQGAIDDLSATRFSTILERPGGHFVRQMCRHCLEPACVSACLVGALQRTEAGPVIYDGSRCMGCRYCMAACPYEARRFNIKKPEVPRADINVNQGYLSNRMRPRGVVEKCHFCLHRTREGAYPACLEACPTGARKFGNITDPDSEISQIVRDKRVFALKEELNTVPHVFYYFD